METKIGSSKMYIPFHLLLYGYCGLRNKNIILNYEGSYSQQGHIVRTLIFHGNMTWTHQTVTDTFDL